MELGAGCGLVGMALAWLGADVYLTDLYDQIDVMDANVDRNFGHNSKHVEEDDRNNDRLVRPVKIHVGELDWSASAEGTPDAMLL